MSPTLPLSALAEDVRVAREAVQAMRASPSDRVNLGWARETLLCAMEVYAAELTARRLPVPHQLRDDLRLQRELRRAPGGSEWRRHG